MKAIPNRVAVLDSTRKRIGYLTRVSPETLSEADCDRLIADNLELVAETLRAADILAESSDLVLLGRQVRKIDLLCAERDLRTDELRRLVLIEDKLFRNPEARRKVVAQLLDYASELETLDPQSLIEGVDPEVQGWLEDQTPLLKRLLATSDYLLLVAGDDIQPRAVQLVERMARDRNPLAHTDVAMLALSIFRDGDRMLLLPNVVGGVVGSQRELRVHVEISTADLPALPVQIKRLHVSDTAQGEAEGRLGSADVREFFASDAWQGHPADAAKTRQFFEALDAAAVPGLRVSTTESGRPVVHLDDTRVGSLKVLAAMNSRRGIWDSLVAREARKAEADPATASAVAAFRSRLVQLGFTQHMSQRTEGAVEVLERRQAEIIEAIRELASATRAT